MKTETLWTENATKNEKGDDEAHPAASSTLQEPVVSECLEPETQLAQDANEISQESELLVLTDENGSVPPFQQRQPETATDEERPKQPSADAAEVLDGDNDTRCCCLGWIQFFALLRKNFLTRFRTPFATVFELLSPFLMMLILVAARQMAETEDKVAQTYYQIQLDFPGLWLDFLKGGGGSNSSNSSSFERRRLIFQEDDLKHDWGLINSYDEDANDNIHIGDWNKLLEDLQQQQQELTTSRISQRRVLQAQNDGPEEEDDDEEFNTTTTDGYSQLSQAQREIQRFLRNPITVPSFTQYVTLGQILSDWVDISTLPRVFTETRFGKQWGNLLTLGTLHLSPQSNNRSVEFWNFLNETYNDTNVTVRLHENEGVALQYIQDHVGVERTWALLEFSDWVNDTDARFTIRMNYTTLPNTNEITDYVAIGLNKDYQRYYLSGYLTLQRTLNEFAASRFDIKNSSSSNATMESCSQVFQNVSDAFYSMPMPTAAYTQNIFFLAVGPLLGLTVTMSYLYPFSRFIKLLVEEKETKMREVLFIMGVRPWAHWLSWLTTTLVVFFLIAVLVTWILSAYVLTYSSTALLFVWVWLFSTASIGFGFVIAAIFNQAKLASIIGPIALFATLLPHLIFVNSNRYENTSAKVWASLLPATAFAFGADVVSSLEYIEQGVQSYNVDQGDYSFSTSLTMMLFDTVLYMALGWYLDQVLPREYGSPKPWYFLISPKHWIACLPGMFQWKHAENVSASESSESVSVCANSDHEPVLESSLRPRVQIRNLVKRYTKSIDKPPAVNNLNLTLYESEITSLLGANGAGKSTTVSILSGLLAPTSGDCIIYGKSITRDRAAARTSIGICPQQNILFENLTVLEHIAFFQRIKGSRPSKAGTREQAEEVDLHDYFHTTASALSGGNKRKLCLAMALAGSPRCVILDEPTSGMDPNSRRACWEVLRNNRSDRVMLLITHFMDEAEMLGDRVAVMKDGLLQCSGRPIFLKQRFGLGYNLQVVVEDSFPMVLTSEDDTEANSGLESSRQLGDSAKLLSVLQKYISDASLRRRNGKELSFSLPKGSEPAFPDIFEELESRRSELGVCSLGIENSSLEEVFLALADRNGNESDDSVSSSDVLPRTGEADSKEISSTCPDSNPQSAYSHLGSFRQVFLLYWKRWVIQRRDIKGSFYLIVVPVILVALVLLILTIDVSSVGPAIEISPALYRTSSTGGLALTDVVVGVGQTGLGNVTKDALSEFTELEEVLQLRYPHAQLQYQEKISSSGNMSKHLLETYNLKTHNTRFGAFVLRDQIPLNITVNWSELGDDIRSMNNDTIGNLVQSLNVISELSNSGLQVTLPASQIARLLPGYSEALALVGLQGDDPVTLRASEASWDPISSSVLFSGTNVQSGDTVLLEGVTLAVPFDTLVATLPRNGTVHYLRNLPSHVSSLHNASSSHAVGAFTMAYMDFLFKSCSGNKSLNLTSTNHPLPQTTQQSLEQRTFLSIYASMFLLIPYCYIPGAFIVFVVKERACKSKHLQLVSGVSMLSYWTATYAWDVTLYGLLTVLIMAVFSIYGQNSAAVFVGSLEAFFCTALLTFGYGLSILPFSYLLSRRATNYSSAQIFVVAMVFITGFVAVVCYFIMSSLENTRSLAEGLRPLFRCWPAYNLGDGLIQMSYAYFEREVLDKDSRPFDWDVAGKPLVLLYGLSIAYFLLLIILECASDGGTGGRIGLWMRLLWQHLEMLLLRCYGLRVNADGYLLVDDGLDDATTTRDEEVLKEKELITQEGSSLSSSSSVLYDGMWKVYPPSVGFFGVLVARVRLGCVWLCSCVFCRQKGDSDVRIEQQKALVPKRAVLNLSISVQFGEVFALLGTNGAGKTTSLGVLTGDVAPSAGRVFVAGYDVSGRTQTGVAEARKRIGFCPQIDPLLDLMTCRETLHFFGRLRGIPRDLVGKEVEQMLQKLTLTPHADKTTESCSGGNKRKLSLGIALIGAKPSSVLLIDEPSSGLDPVARRKGMWSLISDFSKDKSVILTTHSMHEAEALCSRVAIMKDGQLLCLGSVQQLKSKYLNGYTIDVLCEAECPDERLDTLVEEILTHTLPGSELFERHGHFLRFSVLDMAELGLGTVFRRLEGLKQNVQWFIQDYAISQCSLEQVFVKLVNEAQNDLPDSESVKSVQEE